MKHSNSIRQFGRDKQQREALMRSLARSLVLHGRIETTEAKAKSLRPFVERLVTTARKNDLAARRMVVSRLQDETAAKKLVEEIAPKYMERAGGYTRITKLPIRSGDAAKMAVIEFV